MARRLTQEDTTENTVLQDTTQSRSAFGHHEREDDGDATDDARAGRMHAYAFLRVGGMNPRNQIVILHPGQFRMQNSKPIPSGA